MHFAVAAIAALLSALLAASPLLAESPQPPVLLDNMDDAAPALRLLDAAPGVRLIDQAVVAGENRFGDAAERVRLTVPPGSSGLLGYELPPAPVINELKLSAWVFCNRPGARLAATVVLPRSVDPDTGRPRQLLVRSDELASAGQWQQISLDQLRSAVERNARVARAQHSVDIDEREAFVSQLIVMAPGGAGAIELWVDQIAMYGVLASPQHAAATSPVVPVAAESPSKASDLPEPSPPPLCPRIIQWQGEPFALLQQIGFDGVWMARPPKEDELSEARRLGLALVCPPPDSDPAGALPIDRRHDPVMAWDLGELATQPELSIAEALKRQLRQADYNRKRPSVIRPLGMAREASAIADVMLAGRPMADSSLSWPAYAIWLGQQRRLARPGTPIWTAIDTHGGARRRAQAAALGGGEGGFVPMSFADLSQATTAAMSVRPSAFCFQSQASLASPDQASRMRRLALELTNLRLGLAQPWLAASKSAAAARCNRDDLTALVLKIERSHLIVPLRWTARDGQAPLGPTATGVVSSMPVQPVVFVLPGVPESADAYVLSMAGPQRLPTRRVTGGLEIAVERLPDDAMVLLTDDGFAFSHVERYLRERAPQAARVRVELAALRRQQARQALAALPPPLADAANASHELARVDQALAAVVETMRRREFGAAWEHAAEAERLLDQLQSRLSSEIAASLPGASMLPVHWTTMGDLARAAALVARSANPYQLLPYGDFEAPDEFVQSDWQRIQAPAPQRVAIRLSGEAPFEGRYCLELDAQPHAPGALPTAASQALAWVTSPPISTPPGHLLEIAGWARVPEPIGTVDPLVIFDSIGGEESAIRIDAAPSWTPFRLVRAVPPGAECRLTISLGGVGRAQVDALRYRFIEHTAPPAAVARR